LAAARAALIPAMPVPLTMIVILRTFEPSKVNLHKKATTTPSEPGAW